MKIQKFEELQAWQKSQDVAFQVYALLKDNKDFSFKDQIQRASISMSNNIAEGFDRNNLKEFRRFLYYSKASCGEVKSMTYLAIRLNYLSNKEGNNVIQSCDEVSRIIKGLLNSIQTKIAQQ
jgi:four helix bundle protein